MDDNLLSIAWHEGYDDWINGIYSPENWDCDVLRAEYEDGYRVACDDAYGYDDFDDFAG